MFKTATAAALILAATSAGAMAQTTLKAGNYFSATAFTAITNDAGGTCAGLGLKAGNVNYGSYVIGKAVLGKSPVSLLNAQPSGDGVTTPYALAATTCTLGSGFPAPVAAGGVALAGGTSTCNGGVYQLVPTTGATAPTLTALSTSSFTLASNVDIYLPSASLTLCSISITTLGIYTGQ